MSACLISDLHLQENRPELTKAFKKFLVSHAANVDSLYILGDLFHSKYSIDKTLQKKLRIFLSY